MGRSQPPKRQPPLARPGCSQMSRQNTQLIELSHFHYDSFHCIEDSGWHITGSQPRPLRLKMLPGWLSHGQRLQMPASLAEG